MPFQHRHKVRSYRPAVEVLEARNLLSTYMVDHLADDLVGSGPSGSLRYCMTQAADGDNITFAGGAAGVINLAGALPDLAHSVSIQGPGAALLTVRRDTEAAYRIFTISGSPTISISGLTLSNGRAPLDEGNGNARGGAIFVPGGSLTLTECVLTGNLAMGLGLWIGFGGAVAVADGGNLTVQRSTILGNQAIGGPGAGLAEGGGIYVALGGTATIDASNISGNQATGGNGTNGGYAPFGVPHPGGPGGAAHGGGLLAGGGGGSGQSVVTVTNSTISGNSVRGGNGGNGANALRPDVGGAGGGNGGLGDGAGLSLWGGTLDLRNVTVAGNTARGGNGGNGGNGNSSYHGGNGGNGGLGEGAGLSLWGGTLDLRNVTVAGNTAEDSLGGVGGSGTPPGTPGSGQTGEGGGGIQLAYATVDALNCLFANNTAAVHPDFSGNFASASYTCLRDGTGSNLVNGVNGNQLGSAAQPLDALLGPLADNGGPTRTMALLAGSPALNSGDPAQLEVADQRGVVRRGGVNIGAYQASASAFVLTAPPTVTAGTPFTITVKTVDPFGQTAVGYTGTVHFVASNGAMANYSFTAADAGQHTFAGLVLRRAGTLTVSGTDTADAFVTGSTSFTITPAAPDHLLFLQQPTDTAAGQTIGPAVMVAVVDQFGNVETGDNSDTVTLSIGVNPDGGTLRGTLTVTVSGGIATFSDLSIDRAGAGYTLHAMATGVTDADSLAFRIT
jgi:hypothetical protein